MLLDNMVITNHTEYKLDMKDKIICILKHVKHILGLLLHKGRDQSIRPAPGPRVALVEQKELCGFLNEHNYSSALPLLCDFTARNNLGKRPSA